MARLLRDPDNPTLVRVYPDHGSFLWFKWEPKRNIVFIQGRGQRETLDLDTLRQEALGILHEFKANSQIGPLDT